MRFRRVHAFFPLLFVRWQAQNEVEGLETKNRLIGQLQRQLEDERVGSSCRVQQLEEKLVSLQLLLHDRESQLVLAEHTKERQEQLIQHLKTSSTENVSRRTLSEDAVAGSGGVFVSHYLSSSRTSYLRRLGSHGITILSSPCSSPEMRGCMYVYMYMCMPEYVCMYICTYVCPSMYVCMSRHVCACDRVSAQAPHATHPH